MSKAEEFIQQNTKDCTNKSLKEGEYYLWLTLSDTRKAVEIAREEILLNVTEWIKDTFIFSENAKKDFSQTFNIKLL